MPAKHRLPPHGHDPARHTWAPSRAVGSCTKPWQDCRLPVSRLLPQIRIAHRLIGNVAIGFREIVDHEFIAVLDGHGDAHIGHQRHRYGPGTLLVIPPCTPHVLITRCGAQGDHMAVHFDWAWDCPDRSLARRSRGNYRVIIDGLPPLGPVLPLDAVTINLLAEVVRQHHAGDPRARLRAGMALLQTVLHLSESQPTTATREGDDPAVAAALACIANHYREPLCCEDLATATGLHRSRFAQRFKAWTGRPPLAFLRRYRIDRAGELLRADPECPLAAIATACGFADAFAFSKAFKAELGVSPAVFRQQQPG